MRFEKKLAIKFIAEIELSHVKWIDTRNILMELTLS